MNVKQVPYLYHLNKLLFYQWTQMGEEGLGEAFPHDRFLKERKGPVPEHIGEDLKRLETEGLVRVRWPTGTDHKPVPVELTPKGKALFETLQPHLDTELLEATSTLKATIFPLSPKELMDKVHEDF